MRTIENNCAPATAHTVAGANEFGPVRLEGGVMDTALSQFSTVPEGLEKGIANTRRGIHVASGSRQFSRM